MDVILQCGEMLSGFLAVLFACITAAPFVVLGVNHSRYWYIGLAIPLLVYAFIATFGKMFFLILTAVTLGLTYPFCLPFVEG